MAKIRIAFDEFSPLNAIFKNVVNVLKFIHPITIHNTSIDSKNINTENSANIILSNFFIFI